MKVAVLQLSSQGLSSTKLLNYVRIAHKKNVKLLLLGEYILNPFFHELTQMSKRMIKEQAKHQIKILKELAVSYNMIIVAPIVTFKKDQVLKMVAKISPTSTAYYQQQILINYPHWNEEKFFDNSISTPLTPYVFKVENIKFAILSGFELHFDDFFQKLRKKNIDCILVPSVATFDSYERWKALSCMRSFTNNCYILRANRIGEYNNDTHGVWKFYGDSFLSSPDGELLTHLGNKEELMIAEIQHSTVKEAKKRWGFLEALKKREKSN
ncbi:MAG: carbon-nitrogen hydrolase family protein [Epsilonproteobacteria bacterium]|nr:carbon-nitrogen hydrolase family protein [Campylobacterota bacterium]